MNIVGLLDFWSFRIVLGSACRDVFVIAVSVLGVLVPIAVAVALLRDLRIRLTEASFDLPVPRLLRILNMKRTNKIEIENSFIISSFFPSFFRWMRIFHSCFLSLLPSTKTEPQDKRSNLP